MTDADRTAILLTSTGSLVAQNILDSLAERRHGLCLIGSNSIAAAPGNFRCDRTYLVPPTHEREAFRRRFLEIMDVEGPGLVIPTREEDVIALADLAADHERVAEAAMVGGADIARLIHDKVACYAYASERGLPFVETVASDAPAAREAVAGLVARHGFPLIAKPRHGTGSRGVRVLLDRTQLERSLARPDLAIQPFIDPPADLTLDLAEGLPFHWGVPEERFFGVQVSVGRSGRLVSVFGYHAKMVMGRVEHLVAQPDAELARRARAIAGELAASGWRGPLNLQFKQDSARGHLCFEMNGRFAGATSARRLFGHDEVGAAINDWLGRQVVEPPAALPSACMLVEKHLTDFPVFAGPADELAADGVWVARWPGAIVG